MVDRPVDIIYNWLLKKYPIKDLEYREGIKKELMDSEIRYRNFLVLKVCSRVGIYSGGAFSDELEKEIMDNFFSGEESGFNYDVEQILGHVRGKYVKVLSKHFGK
ncbi:MAG: hypothetical protein EBY07_12650 [Actinobacteria bacterium]|nr:hypothetical protein [Actinomycetota bacterium]